MGCGLDMLNLDNVLFAGPDIKEKFLGKATVTFPERLFFPHL